MKTYTIFGAYMLYSTAKTYPCPPGSILFKKSIQVSEREISWFLLLKPQPEKTVIPMRLLTSFRKEETRIQALLRHPPVVGEFFQYMRRDIFSLPSAEVYYCSGRRTERYIHQKIHGQGLGMKMLNTTRSFTL